MDVKPRKSKKKQDTWLDPFTKRLLSLLIITVPVLAYFILKPSAQTQAQNLEQAKQFAQFIETKPELAQREVASEQHVASQPVAPVKPAIPIEPAQNLGAQPSEDPNLTLTLDDRIEINNMAAQWNQVDFARNNVWRDQ